MLGVGIGLAEEFHLVALGRPGEGVFDVTRVEHDPASVDALVARIATIEGDPAEVRVVLETSHGMLVERLVDAGYVVVPVNPDLVAPRFAAIRSSPASRDHLASGDVQDRSSGGGPLTSRSGLDQSAPGPPVQPSGC